ncbi:MAG: outer membrane protein assembly factor BamC [Betaproteobacteria bacterium]|nr:outer membrane protein assembly factor BamC [Betaproteobacteria bacterium]
MNLLLLKNILLCLTIGFSIVACDTVSEKRKVDYKSSGVGSRTEPLVIPPELGTLEQSDRYAIPGDNEATFSKYEKQRSVTGAVSTTDLLPEVPDIKIGREGTYRWLIVDRSVEEIWPVILEFWMIKGFLIADQSPVTGLVETDWASDESQLSVNRLQAWVRKFIPSAFSVPERDKFWTRIERVSPNKTEIFVSHESKRQEVNITPTVREVRWADRPRDPNVEAKMLYELMLYLGLSNEVVAASGLSNDIKPMTTMISVDLPSAKSALLVSGGIDKIWDRIGIILLAIGASVESRDQEKGLYFVRYHDPDGRAVKKGLDRLKFWQDDELTEAAIYQISITGDSETSMVTVYDESGEAVSEDTAQRILSVLQERLG